jgi:hypothetical protein
LGPPVEVSAKHPHEFLRDRDAALAVDTATFQRPPTVFPVEEILGGTAECVARATIARRGTR